MLEVKLGKLKLKNPIILASGTAGYGEELSKFYDLSKLGGIMVKGLTLEPREGNPPPRIAETPAGMLNAIGLQNVGVEKYLSEKLPFLRKHDLAVIANINGNSIEDYVNLTKKITEGKGADAFEVNLSCPNVKEGGIHFGTNPKMVEEVTKAVKSSTGIPIFVKLTPNVTDITGIAKAAEKGGADGLSLINTLLGMAVDWKKKKPKISNVFAGLSGPAIKPVALRCIYQVSHSTSLPIIGMGGITCWEDVVEFMLVGSGAVAIGTTNFVNPLAPIEIINGLEKYCKEENLKNISQITGKIS